jgi:hypothetical protein
MNDRVTETIQIGIIFGIIVVFLDVFLFQLPVLAWLALGLAFFFVAVIIIESMTRLVPRERQRLPSKLVHEDELQHLSLTVHRALDMHDQEAQSMLAEKLRSIVLSTLAARMKVSRREIVDLAEKNSDSLQAIVSDKEMLGLLSGKKSNHESAQQIDQLLSKIEGLAS